MESIELNELMINSIKNDDVLDALESFISVYKERKKRNNRMSIPLYLFANRKLGSLEVIVKYMKENLFMNFSQIAVVINRDQRTVWSTYNNAIKKEKNIFKIKNTNYYVPFEIFSKRNCGPLEVLVVYLKEELSMGFKQIAQLLNRDYNTIWLSYRNGKKNDK